jgi:large subunit ribosomal protein L10
MSKAERQATVDEITVRFRESQAALLTEYRGLTVKQLKELRRSLGATTQYAVAKNTLTKIAAKEAGIEGLDELLVGPSAIAFVSGDPVEAAKGLRDFAKTHPLLVIKGGVMDGKPLSAAEISKLADLESREVLLAKAAGAMKATLANAAALFQAPLTQFARTADALRAKVEQGSPAAVSDAPVADADVQDAPVADAAE